jgi:hypothetical protein
MVSGDGRVPIFSKVRIQALRTRFSRTKERAIPQDSEERPCKDGN